MVALCLFLFFLLTRGTLPKATLHRHTSLQLIKFSFSFFVFFFLLLLKTYKIQILPLSIIPSSTSSSLFLQSHPLSCLTLIPTTAQRKAVLREITPNFPPFSQTTVSSYSESSSLLGQSIPHRQKKERLNTYTATSSVTQRSVPSTRNNFGNLPSCLRDAFFGNVKEFGIQHFPLHPTRLLPLQKSGSQPQTSTRNKPIRGLINLFAPISQFLTTGLPSMALHV